MSRESLESALRGGVLVCDGAMGTMLHAAGNSLDQALPALNVSAPDLVRTVHDSYVGVGVDVLQTNTFGASRLRLSEYGQGDQTEAINRAGAAIAIQAAAQAERPVLVAGSVAPAVSVRQRRRTAAGERTAAIREQLDILTDSGVDLILLETFGYLDELVEAVHLATEATAGTGLPIIAQATFSTSGHTISGHTPGELVRALADTPIVALGTNCTLGPQRSLTVLRELREHTDLPLTVQPNAGLPRRVAPGHFEYDINDAYFARYVRQLIETGAALVGGCCGTTPSQLAAIVATADEYRTPLAAEPAHTEPVTITEAPVPEPAEHAVIVEISPPRSGGVEESTEVVAALHEAGISTVSVAAEPDTAGARLNPVNLALHLHQHLGIDTLAAVTTWDRTIMALQADLLGAHALGIRGIVCETGTPPLLGDYPHVDGIWDVDSVGLIELLAGLNAGQDYYGLPLAYKTDFHIGARINPGSRELDRIAEQATAKITAGAQFLITRPVYELTGLYRLLDALDGGQVPVYVAIRPLTSFDEADYLANEVPDVTIPDSTLSALHQAGNGAADAGLDLAAALAAEVRTLGGKIRGTVLAPSADPIAAVRRLTNG